MTAYRRYPRIVSRFASDQTFETGKKPSLMSIGYVSTHVEPASDCDVNKNKQFAKLCQANPELRLERTATGELARVEWVERSETHQWTAG
jgi:hypothetical protein